MIDYAAIAAAGGIGKGQSRRDHKLTVQAEAKKADDAARDAAWTASKGVCPRCGKRMNRGGGLLHGAEFNHTTPVSKGGRKVPVGEWTHHHCHFSGPSGGHRR